MKLLIVLLSCMSMILCQIPVNAQHLGQSWDQWRNVLAPQGEPSGPLTLARDGKAEYVILLPARPTTQEQKAAEELAMWLGEMTGAQWPLTKEPGQAAEAKFISVGRTELLRRAGLEASTIDLGDEGYAIGQQDGNIYLFGGKTRGPITAVFSLLEEDLGCRWYTSGRYVVTAGNVNRIPRRPNLQFEPVPRSYVPAMNMREPHYIEAFDETWSLRNRTNSTNAPIREEWGGHIDYSIFVHSFNQLVPPGHFADHPDYFMLDENGNRITRQLCLSNPQIVPIAVKNMREVLKASPLAEIISVSANDGGGRCHCPPCRALDKAATAGKHCPTDWCGAGSLLHFVNQVAEAVEKEYPHVLISTLAYMASHHAPVKVKCRDNVAIRLCNHSQILNWPLDFTTSQDTGAKYYRQQIINWSKITKNLHIWEYVGNYPDILMPNPNMHVIAQTTRYYEEHGVSSIMFQGNHGSTIGSERALMRVWVMAKLLWDSSRDMGELQKDFIWGFYGAAAPAIFEYYQLLDELAAGKFVSPEWTRSAIDLKSIPVDGAKAFHRRAAAIFDWAEALTDDVSIRQRVELERIAVMYAKLSRGAEFVAGLGQDHVALIDRFESIAQRENIRRIGYSETVDQKVDQWRKQANTD